MKADTQPDPPRFVTLKRPGLLSATTLIALNIWTGAPLLALWIGSRIVGRRALSMAAVFVVVALLAVFVTAMAFMLTWLSARYDELIDRPSGERRSPWLRSMRGEREEEMRSRLGTSALERIVMTTTVIAVLLLEVWFFFFAGSPLPRL
jgi:hypothetical protein